MIRLRTDKGNTTTLDSGWKFVELLAEDGTLGAVIFMGDDGLVFLLHEGCEGKEKELWDQYVTGLSLTKSEITDSKI